MIPGDFVAGGLAGSTDCERYEVWLDGRREPLAIRASHWGYLIRYVTDADGAIVLDPFGNARTERVEGKIEIRSCN